MQLTLIIAQQATTYRNHMIDIQRGNLQELWEGDLAPSGFLDAAILALFSFGPTDLQQHHRIRVRLVDSDGNTLHEPEQYNVIPHHGYGVIPWIFPLKVKLARGEHAVQGYLNDEHATEVSLTVHAGARPRRGA